jgi:hypothetical protein
MARDRRRRPSRAVLAPGSKAKSFDRRLRAMSTIHATQRTSASFTHGGNASGARHLRAGFARDAEHDLRFALGWPHVRFLVDAHPDDQIADPAKDAETVIQKVYGIDVPARVARRRVRVLTVDHIAPDGRGGWLPEAVGVALARDEPVTEAEARAIIASQMQKPLMGAGQHEMLLLLEAMVGSDVVADALVGALEAVPASDLLLRHQDRNIWTHHLGLILLRASSASAATLRARLEKVLDAANSAGPANKAAPSRTLDVVLHGAEGARRSALLDPWHMLNVHDAPDLVATQVETQKLEPATFVPYVRLAFLGGDRVLDVYATRWQKLKSAEDQRAFFVGLSAIAKGKALTILHEMAASSKVKKEVAAWFAANPDVPRPSK